MNIKLKKFCLDDKYYFENGGREHLHNKYGLSLNKLLIFKIV